MPAIEQMPDLDAAMARLDAAEATEASYTPTPPVAEQVDDAGDQPPEVPIDGIKTPDFTPKDTPAAAEPKPTAPKTPEIQKPDKGSHFAKDQKRKDDSWKALNTEKEAHKKAQDEFNVRQAQFKAEQQRIEEKRAKAQSKYTPEQYEENANYALSNAQQQDIQAKGWEAQAAELEGQGKFAEAEQAKAKAQQLRESAIYQRQTANNLKLQADHIRKNPDPTLQQIQQRTAQQLQSYTMEAAKKWPELAKEGSEFQKTVVGHIKAARKAGLDENEFPVLRYHAARLAAAETDAARVPSMEKELGELRAKIKELEALTSPGGGSPAVAKVPSGQPLSDTDEADALRAEALSRS